MRSVLAVSAATLMLVALPGAADQKRDPVPAATPAGKPVDCISTRNIRETRVRDDKTIDFYMRGGKIYRNDLDGMACPRLGFERRFSYRTTIGQLCSVDVITVLQEPGLSAGASCGLGKFQPVTIARTQG